MRGVRGDHRDHGRGRGPVRPRRAARGTASREGRARAGQEGPRRRAARRAPDPERRRRGAPRRVRRGRDAPHAQGCGRPRARGRGPRARRGPRRRVADRGPRRQAHAGPPRSGGGRRRRAPCAGRRHAGGQHRRRAAPHARAAARVRRRRLPRRLALRGRSRARGGDRAASRAPTIVERRRYRGRVPAGLERRDAPATPPVVAPRLPRRDARRLAAPLRAGETRRGVARRRDRVPAPTVPMARVPLGHGVRRGGGTWRRGRGVEGPQGRSGGPGRRRGPPRTLREDRAGGPRRPDVPLAVGVRAVRTVALRRRDRRAVRVVVVEPLRSGARHVRVGAVRLLPARPPRAQGAPRGPGVGPARVGDAPRLAPAAARGARPRRAPAARGRRAEGPARGRGGAGRELDAVDVGPRRRAQGVLAGRRRRARGIRPGARVARPAGRCRRGARRRPCAPRARGGAAVASHAPDDRVRARRGAHRGAGRPAGRVRENAPRHVVRVRVERTHRGQGLGAVPPERGPHAIHHPPVRRGGVHAREGGTRGPGRAVPRHALRRARPVQRRVDVPRERLDAGHPAGHQRAARRVRQPAPATPPPSGGSTGGGGPSTGR